MKIAWTPEVLPMLILDRRRVEAIVDLDRLVDAVESAMIDFSRGRASMPARIAAVVPEHDAMLAAMPAYLPSAQALTTKLVSLWPHNKNRPTHQAIVACFDPETGTPVALMDGTFLTEARTAAGSALSTRLLAREDAAVLAIVGTGVQARSHARAVVRVRPIRSVLVAGRSPERARGLAGDLASSLEVECRAAGSFEEAVRAADIVCATTHSPDPVVLRNWLSPGTHVTSVGYNVAGREIDPRIVADAIVVVESREAVLAPPPSGANDIAWAIRDGLIGPEHIHAEIGEVAAGTRPGRTSPEQITLYKSVGVAIQDAAAAALVLGEAHSRGVGVEVDL